MEHSNLDRHAAIKWDCSVCGRSRLCPYSAPTLSQGRTEACRTCGDPLIAETKTSDGALKAAISHHLI